MEMSGTAAVLAVVLGPLVVSGVVRLCEAILFSGKGNGGGNGTSKPA